KTRPQCYHSRVVALYIHPTHPRIHHDRRSLIPHWQTSADLADGFSTSQATPNLERKSVSNHFAGEKSVPQPSAVPE
ncbi:unnamed protein product, partial [Mycena citricolor]